MNKGPKILLSDSIRSFDLTIQLTVVGRAHAELRATQGEQLPLESTNE